MNSTRPSSLSRPRPLALLNDLLYDADSGPLGEALRPMYVDYLLEHDRAEREPEAGDA